MASIPTISSRATPAELQRFARAVKNFLDSGEFKLDTTAISKQIDRALRDYEEQTTDLTPPGPPVELVVTGLFDKIMLEWGPATGNVAYYEVFRNMEDDLGNAAMVSPRIGAAMWVDTPPDSSLSATYYYWVRAVSPAGIAGPFNAAAGTPGSTADDPAYVLEVLTGEITEGQLYQDLNTRINKIEVNEAAISINTTAIRTEQTVRQDADNALAQDVTTLQARVGGNTSAILTEQTARINGDDALASNISTLQARVGDNTTAIRTEQTARINGDDALASNISTLQVVVGGVASSLQTKAEVSDLKSVYEVKTDINGRVTGFGMVADATSTEFGINADRFWIADPSNSANVKIPFVIDNGQVVMDTALIKNGTITNAKIRDLAVDSAKIADLAVHSAKIANAAITVAKIADAAITTAKIADLAVISAKIATAAITEAKIGNAAVTNAKIANAAITYAKIGDAEVDTLKLAGQAVTIPVAAESPNGSASVTYTATGNNVHIIGLAGISTMGDGKNSGTIYGTVSIKYNNTAIAGYTFTMPISNISNSMFLPITNLHTPTAGSATYEVTITASTSSGLPFSFVGTSVLALEVKR